MAINRFDQPVRQTTTFQPNVLPFDLLYKAVASRQADYDKKDQMLGLAQANFGSIVANNPRDAKYLAKKQAEFNSKVKEWSTQDLTRIPNLNGEILGMVSDPKLGIIKTNNEALKTNQELYSEIVKDPAKAHPANLSAFSNSYNAYNAVDADPELARYQSPTAAYNYRDELLEVGKLINDNVTSVIQQDASTGAWYVNKKSTKDYARVLGILKGSLSDQALTQLKTEYDYNGGDEKYGDFDTYALIEAAKLAPAFAKYQEEMVSVDWAHATINAAKGGDAVDGVYDFNATGGGAPFNWNRYGIKFEDGDIFGQISSVLKTKESALEVTKERFDSYIPVEDSGEIVVKKFENGKWVDTKIAAAYKDDKGVLKTGEALQAYNTREAQKHEIAVLKEKKQIVTDEALAETKKWAEKNGRTKHFTDLESQIRDGGEIDYEEFVKDNPSSKNIIAESRSETFGKAFANHRVAEGAGYIINEDGSVTIQVQTGDKGKTSPLKLAANSAEVKNWKKLTAEAIEKKSPLLSKFREEEKKAAESQFIVSATLSPLSLFNRGDKDTEALEQTINYNLDNITIYDNRTGKIIENFGSTHLSDKGNYEGVDSDNVKFAIEGVYYNALLAEWMVQGQVIGMDESGKPIFTDGSNNKYSVSLQNLDENLMQILYGKNAEDVDAQAAQLSDAFNNATSNTIELPIMSMREVTNMYATKNDDGSITANWFDPTLKEYKTMTEPSIVSFADKLASYNKLQTGLVEADADKVKEQVVSDIRRNSTFASIFNKNPELGEAAIQEILHMISKESGFNTSIANRDGSGAAGLFQFMQDSGQAGDDPNRYKTIGGVKYPITKIQNMGVTDQVNLYINGFLGPNLPKVISFNDLTANKRGAFKLYSLQPAWITSGKVSPSMTVFEANKEIEQSPAYIAEVLKKNAGYFKTLGITKGMSDDAAIEIAKKITVEQLMEAMYQ